ncbi:MAG: sigma-70 family RNA polymerase sigma factor, partial [Prosthecobacter sp.]|nr:sigma-70 family RNA polymerase sigma factor [Prosthecobacter sp.]
AEGKQTQFEALKPWLMGDAAHGDQAALAAACGLGVSALKMAIQRLRLRFRECLQAEIAGTLEDAAMVQEEMCALMAALAT